jgi:hypothetical protein
MTVSFVKPVAGELITVSMSADGGTSYTLPALINTTRGITQTNNAASDEIVDANNPSAAAKTVRAAKSTDSKIDGAGIMDLDSYATWAQWAGSGGAPRMCKLVIAGTGSGATTVTVTYTGLYMLTQFQLTGTRTQKATITLTLEQADQPTIVVV